MRLVPYNTVHLSHIFQATQGTTRGVLASLALFNFVVDNFIRTWMAMTVEDQRVACNGMEEAIGRCLGVFYANDGMVGSRDSEWLQHLMNILVGLFKWYGLAANVAKSCTMTYRPISIRSGMSEEAKDPKCTGVGDSYRMRLYQWIPCP